LKRSRNEYLSLRRRYEPESIKLVIVAESPPASGRYFYDPDGRRTEPLFAALMKQLNYPPDTKESGIREIQRRGWVLVDATYDPINDRNNRKREKAIIRDYPLLRNDLKSLKLDSKTPIILIKANVCRALEPRLISDGFNVINGGKVVYFPASGRQSEFRRQFRAIFNSAEV